MMKILHGDNVLESRKTLINLIDKAKGGHVEVVVCDGSKITLSDLRKALGSTSLFGDEKLVVVEDFFVSQKSKERAKIIEYVTSGNFSNELVFWESKEVKKTDLPPKVTVEIFKITPLIFRFLDLIKPGNSSQLLSLLLQIKTREDPEMIFFMIVRQLRFLIMAKDNCLSGLPDWQRRKLSDQARLFTKEKLLEIYSRLAVIDFSQKTSSDSYNLSSRLDLLFANL